VILWSCRESNPPLYQAAKDVRVPDTPDESVAGESPGAGGAQTEVVTRVGLNPTSARTRPPVDAPQAHLIASASQLGKNANRNTEHVAAQRSPTGGD
jgi:hypothetical protein